MIVMKLVGSLVSRTEVKCCGELLSASRDGSVGLVLKWFSGGRTEVRREHVYKRDLKLKKLMFFI